MHAGCDVSLFTARRAGERGREEVAAELEQRVHGFLDSVLGWRTRALPTGVGKHEARRMCGGPTSRGTSQVMTEPASQAA